LTIGVISMDAPVDVAVVLTVGQELDNVVVTVLLAALELLLDDDVEEELEWVEDAAELED
jgi:hypothetical protein